MLSRVETNRPMANSRVSPGRNGKNSPHSMTMITRQTQKNEEPNWSSNQLGSIHLIPNNSGYRPVTH